MFPVAAVSPRCLPRNVRGIGCTAHRSYRAAVACVGHNTYNHGNCYLAELIPRLMKE